MPKKTALRCDAKLLSKDLTGKVCVVTGANTGSGFFIAKQLAAQKATVVLACRNEEKAKQAAAQIGTAGAE